MNGEPKETSPQPIDDDVEKTKKWVKDYGSVTVAAIAVCVAIYSAFNASRSADASIMSARAAMTNADWASYQRNPSHDVIGRVLQVGSILRDKPIEFSNSVAYVDLALINNGNQSEVIRRVTLYYEATENAPYGVVNSRILNSQLLKGDKQVLHFTVDRNNVYGLSNVWVKVGVTMIGPDANDIESKWLAAWFRFRPDGAEWQFHGTNSVRVVSNERLSHQKAVDLQF